ncbi:hypothetical protein FS749_008153 [Ceratobasidium sp. UAMH 11750]|nr:hypothetical protein FS749_008153 [Ceratobasidium sp. UAMH 11750]
MTLTAVCSHWRELVIQSPSLWSHIDVVFSHDWRLLNSKRTKLWIERSRGVTLDIHISESEIRGTGLRPNPSADEIKRAIKILKPLMSRTVDLRINIGSQEILDQVIKCWFKRSLPIVPNSLHIFNPSQGTEPLTLRARSVEGREDQVEKYSKVFHTCHRLSLKKCRILVPASFHGGLVELRLERPPSPLALLELLAILAANPRLRILALLDVAIRSPEDEQEALGFLVTINCLESLTIYDEAHSNNYHLFLPILSIGSDALNLSLCLLDDPRFITACHSFLRRTTVTTLHAYNLVGYMTPAAILCPMPHLQTMAIEGCGVVLRDLSGLLAAHFYNSEYNPWPSLHTLYLDGGLFSLQLIQAFAQIRSVQRLRMYGISVFKFESPLTKRAREQLHGIMSGVEDFGIYEQDQSPVRNWTFVNPVQCRVV